jgi:hypothetical protein
MPHRQPRVSTMVSKSTPPVTPVGETGDDFGFTTTRGARDAPRSCLRCVATARVRARFVVSLRAAPPRFGAPLRLAPAIRLIFPITADRDGAPSALAMSVPDWPSFQRLNASADVSVVQAKGSLVAVWVIMRPLGVWASPLRGRRRSPLRSALCEIPIFELGELDTCHMSQRRM